MYTLSNVKDISSDFKTADIKSNDGVATTGVGIGRKAKDGTIQFQTFDAFVDGYQMEGNLWRSPSTGKQYLYPIREPKPATGAYTRSGGAITKAQEKKAEDIETAQNRKKDAIALAGAFRDATLISLASYRDIPFPTDEEFKAEWIKWVRWILSKNEEPFI
jgi:hypothetical protein